MSAAAAAATANDSAPTKPKSKKLLFIIIGVVMLALVGGGAAFFLMKKKSTDEEGADGAATEAASAPEPPKHDPKAPPTFLPLDAMVVNLADEGGNRFAQLAITLQLTDQKVADDMKAYMPSIRNGILMLISQRTAEQILKIEGKEELTKEIIGEVSAVMGYDYDDPDAEPEVDAKGKKKKKRAVYNPIQGVLFSSFIVQ